MRAAEEERASLNESITVRQGAEAGSHTAGFEAWLRSRGDIKARVRLHMSRHQACLTLRICQVITGDEVADEYGVNKSSYDPVLLPNIKAYTVTVKELGAPADMLDLGTEAVAKELEWGEARNCKCNARAAEIWLSALSPAIAGAGEHPGGAYQPGGPVQRPHGLNARHGAPCCCNAEIDSFSDSTLRSPQVADSDILKTPFVGGNDGLGVVVKVGPGVKNLSDNDWVVPYKPGMGTWRSLAVWREKDVMKIPADLLPVEYGAMLREMCVAYRLLEDNGTLKPGDSVILNAANSTIGTCVIQLCRMLKLRAIAVVRAKDGDELEQAAKRLKALGAAEVRLLLLRCACMLRT